MSCPGSGSHEPGGVVERSARGVGPLAERWGTSVDVGSPGGIVLAPCHAPVLRVPCGLKRCWAPGMWPMASDLQEVSWDSSEARHTGYETSGRPYAAPGCPATTGMDVPAPCHPGAQRIQRSPRPGRLVPPHGFVSTPLPCHGECGSDDGPDRLSSGAAGVCSAWLFGFLGSWSPWVCHCFSVVAFREGHKS